MSTLRTSIFDGSELKPYLYDCSLDYERDYLRVYLRSNGSLVVLAFDDDRVVGATTCLPRLDERPEFQAAFVKAGYDLSTICCFGESILLPEYRGHGIGKEFFARREAHACELGSKFSTLCAVDRPADHSLRVPPGIARSMTSGAARATRSIPSFRPCLCGRKPAMRPNHRRR